MKKIFLLQFLLIIGLGLAFSCTKTKSPDPAPTTVTANPAMTANLDGNAWTATNISGTIYTTYINVTGTAADGTKLKISFPQSIKAGSYTLGQVSESSLSYTTSLGGYSAGNGGSLVITSNSSNIIKGSWSGADLEFYVSTQPTIYGTSGSFEAKYQ